MQIVWDEPKRLANIDKHGLDFADLDEVFFADALVLPARSRRFRGIGASTRAVICVVFARLGGEGVSVISMRPAHQREGGSMPSSSSKNRRYSAVDMRAVSNNREWTRKDFAKAKRFDETFPDLAATIRRRG